jgi:hypothetical protein
LIFPLPLTPFEYFYWCDDRPGYPTSCPFELNFSGVMDRQCFAKAWRTAVERHPLLRARIDDAGKWPVWQTADCPPPVVDWATADKPIADDHCQPIDIASGSGLKAWVRVSETTTRLRLRVHHACSDGAGVGRFLEDVLLAYDQQYHCGAIDDLPDVDVGLLRDRGEIGLVFGQETPHYRATARDGCLTAFEWAKFLTRRSIPLAAALSTRAAIAVLKYADQVSIHLRCDPHCCDAAQAQALLDQYVARPKASSLPDHPAVAAGEILSQRPRGPA